MASVTYNSLPEVIQAEKGVIVSVIRILEKTPKFNNYGKRSKFVFFLCNPDLFFLFTRLYLKMAKLLCAFEKMLSLMENWEKDSNPQWEDVELLKDFKAKSEDFVLYLKELVELQKEKDFLLLLVGRELKIIERLEDQIENLDISTDGEIRKMVFELEKK